MVVGAIVIIPTLILLIWAKITDVADRKKEKKSEQMKGE